MNPKCFIVQAPGATITKNLELLITALFRLAVVSTISVLMHVVAYFAKL